MTELKCEAPGCGYLNRGGAKFCALCGQPLQVKASDRPTETFAHPLPHASVAQNGIPSLWRLFFRPRRFFETDFHAVTKLAVLLAAWLVGVVSAMERIDVKLAFGGSQGPEPVLDSWTRFWLTCALGGIVPALGLYAIAGWWYQVRLRWSGAVHPDPYTTRRVYVLTSLVVTLPAIAYAVGQTIVYPSPRATWEGDSWFDLLILPFALTVPFWSVYISYVGATRVFQLLKPRARLWFLVLPSVFYGAVILGFFAFVVAALGFGLPGLFPPERIERAGFVLQYPGHWFVDDSAEDYDPDSSFTIEPVWDEALVEFTIWDEPVDPASMTTELAEMYKELFSGAEGAPFTTWGLYGGSGAEFFGESDGTRYRVRIFSATENSRAFSVVELSEAHVTQKHESSFALIRESFRFKE